jgi:hydroxyethylthiazole kinase
MTRHQAAAVLEAVRAKTPLIQAICNYVTINDCANILLAFGASPAMCESYQEAYAFTKLAAAAYINLGTLTWEQENVMTDVVLACQEASIPLVLDPVGCAAIPHKLAVIDKLLAAGPVGIIKGNSGEIKCLAGLDAHVRGMDAVEEGDDATEACVTLSRRLGCTVIATGAVDTIASGEKTIRLANGSFMFTKITGAGCMLGALCAATAAVAPEDLFTASVCAVTAMNVAAENAYAEAPAPGSFRMKLMDHIYALEGATLAERMIIHAPS